MQRYAVFIAAKRGLATVLPSGTPAFDALPASFRQRLEPALRALLEAAAAIGEVRAEISAEELLVRSRACDGRARCRPAGRRGRSPIIGRNLRGGHAAAAEGGSGGKMASQPRFRRYFRLFVRSVSLLRRNSMISRSGGFAAMRRHADPLKSRENRDFGCQKVPESAVQSRKRDPLRAAETPA